MRVVHKARLRSARKSTSPSHSDALPSATANTQLCALFHTTTTMSSYPTHSFGVPTASIFSYSYTATTTPNAFGLFSISSDPRATYEAYEALRPSNSHHERCEEAKKSGWKRVFGARGRQ